MKTLRQYRQSLNLTQAEFGQRLGVSGQQVSNWENGFRFPSTTSLFKIAETFGVNVQLSNKGDVKILADEEIPTPPLFDCAQSGDVIVIMSESDFTEGQAISWFYFTYQKDYVLEKFEGGTVADGHFHYMKFKIASN